MSKITALQELIERLTSINNKHDDAGLKTSIDIATQLLTKERADIIEAASEGYEMETSQVIDGEKYYETTFKQ